MKRLWGGRREREGEVDIRAAHQRKKKNRVTSLILSPATVSLF